MSNDPLWFMKGLTQALIEQCYALVHLPGFDHTSLSLQGETKNFALEGSLNKKKKKEHNSWRANVNFNKISFNAADSIPIIIKEKSSYFFLMSI